MNSLLESNRAALAEICHRFGVARLEVFGSAARADFDSSRSDIDLIVQFKEPHPPGYADRYLDLAEALERLLGRRVDLVTERSIRNPIFRKAIAPDRRQLYAA